MSNRTLKQEDLKVVYEYVPAPDMEERLLQIFEFLLQEDPNEECQAPAKISIAEKGIVV